MESRAGVYQVRQRSTAKLDWGRMPAWLTPINVLKLVGLSLLLVFAFVGVDYGETFRTIGDASWSLVLASFLLLNLALLLRAYRWRVLAIASGLIYRSSYDYYAVFYASWLANFILPQGVSSAARLAMISEGGGRSLGRGLAAVIIERLADVAAAGILGLVFMAWVIRNGQGTVFAVVVGLICGGVLLLLAGAVVARRLGSRIGLRATIERYALGRRVMAILDETFIAFSEMERRPLILMTGLSVLTAFILATALYVAALALDIHVPFALMVAAWAVVNLSVMLPISIQGLGPREGILIVALVGSGEAQEAGVALGLLWFVLLSASRLPGIVAWFHRPVAPAVGTPPQVAA
ncbi:MAG: flippase-like domain-containing protein [Dehalococcoidia bacterium]|nr:flippase-like domain-containing protein [Dehalococcoidia bacterium]